MKQIPHLYKNIIHVGSSKFHGSVLSLPFHFCCSIISFQIKVGTIIIWLVVGGVAGLEDKLVDVVGFYKMCDPTIKVAAMNVKEEDLWIELASSTDPTEETNCLHLDIPFHIYRRHAVDYAVNGKVPVKILGLIFYLLNDHR